MTSKGVLKSLGLNDKETALYLALLELGESSVLQISKRSEVKRPTAYLILRSLEEKGLISRVIRGRKTFFSPQHPKKLLTEAELMLKELQATIPQLESLFHKETGRPRVMMYEGKDELDRAYDEWFVLKGELVYIGTIRLSAAVFPRTYKKIEYIRLSPEFKLRELIDESEEAREYAARVRGPYRDVRFLTKEMLPFETDMGVFGNRTLITSVKKEYFTIAIESEEIARAFRVLFEAMWQLSKSAKLLE